MLIHQDLSPKANNKMGYYFRNDGWYRKHFTLPAEWKDTTVHLYIEGSFHRTTVWLNGKFPNFLAAFHPTEPTPFC